MAVGSPKKAPPLVLLDLGYAKMTDCDRRPPAGFAVLWCLCFLFHAELNQIALLFSSWCTFLAQAVSVLAHFCFIAAVTSMKDPTLMSIKSQRQQPVIIPQIESNLYGHFIWKRYMKKHFFVSLKSYFTLVFLFVSDQTC